MAILDVQHIEKSFGSTKVLRDINFSLEEGQVLAIIGSSGSGKTTLLRCLNFLETPDQGTISVRDEVLFDAADPATQREGEIRRKRLHFGLVFQNFNLFPQYTALQNVTLARELMAKGEKTGEDLAAIRAEEGAPADPDGPPGPDGQLSPPALRRAAAAGGHRPGPGYEAGHPLL